MMLDNKFIIFAISIFCGFLLFETGCSRLDKLQRADGVDVLPSFVVRGDVVGCDCSAIGERFAKAEAGLDPTKRDYSWQTPEGLLALLRSDATKCGSTIIVRNVNECLDEMADRQETGPADMTLLVHSSGHLYLLLGTVTIGDVLTYQIVHGNSSVWLVDRDAMAKARFAEAWQFNSTIKEIPIKIGDTTLEVSGHYFNFGKVLPSTLIERVIQIKNIGPKPLILKEPEVSCRCTVANLQTESNLQPNESRQFQVSFQTSAAASERHSVFLRVFEKHTGFSENIEFLLLASQQQSMLIEPTMIDFGHVSLGEKYVRSINISEVPTDRFSITKFDSNNRPLQGKIIDLGTHQGLNTYQVEIEFIPNENEPIRVDDHVTIKTNSILRPEISIPYTYKLIPEISVEPRILSLGSQRVGVMVERRIKIISHKNEIIQCEMRRIPETCKVDIVSQSAPVELFVQVKPTKIGIWQDKIVVAVKTPSREEVLEIECVGYVQ